MNKMSTAVFLLMMMAVSACDFSPSSSVPSASVSESSSTSENPSESASVSADTSSVSGTSTDASSDPEIPTENVLPKPTDQVASLQAICDAVDWAIFYHQSEAKMTLSDYPVSDLDDLLGHIYWTAQLVDINPVISGTLEGDLLTVDFSYRDVTLTAADTQNRYVHAADVAYVPYEPTRDASYENFPYKNRAITVGVSTSEQLWYVLDQGYLPLPEPGSIAESYLSEAETILRSIIGDSMDDLTKLTAIYDWVALNLSYDFTAANLSTTDALAAQYDAFYLEGMMDHRRGVCDAYSKVFTMLANMEGLEAKRVIGPTIAEYNHPVIGSVGHAWNLVKIDGQWYTTDTTGTALVSTSRGKGISSYRFFLTSETYHENNYSSGLKRYAYPDIWPEDSYDYYAYRHYGTETPSAANDLVMSSLSELYDYLAYAASLPTDGVYQYLSGEFEAAFDYGTNFKATLTTALQENGLYSTAMFYALSGGIASVSIR